MACYHAAASYGLPYGASVYFGSPLIGGVALWGAAAALVGLGWGLFWMKDPKKRLYFLICPLIFTAIPPLGVIGWCHPITSAGILFPGLSWLGLALCVGLMIAFARLKPKFVLCGFIVVGLWAYLIDAPTIPLDGWKGIETSAGAYQEDKEIGSDFYRHQNLTRDMLAELPARVILSPESSGGRWHGMAAVHWQGISRQHPGTVFLIGAEYPNDKDETTDNVILSAEAGTVRVIYRQRMPVPLTMYNPLKRDSVHAYWFKNATVEVAGKRGAFLICYEQLLPWTVLHSAAAGTDVFLGSANDWWAAQSNIPEIQFSTMHAWARLFGCPLVVSFNL